MQSAFLKPLLNLLNLGRVIAVWKKSERPKGIYHKPSYPYDTIDTSLVGGFNPSEKY